MSNDPGRKRANRGAPRKLPPRATGGKIVVVGTPKQLAKLDQHPAVRGNELVVRIPRNLADRATVGLGGMSGLRAHGPAQSGLRSGNSAEALAAYARVLLDPWCGWENPARVPQRVAPHSSLFSIRQEYAVGLSTNTNTGVREMAAVFRGGIGAYIAATGVDSHNLTLHPHEVLGGWDNDGTNFIPIDVGGSVNVPTVWRNPSTAPMKMGVYDSSPVVDQVQALYLDHRPVSKAMRVTYTGPKLTSAGKLVAALVPGDMLFDFDGSNNNPLVMDNHAAVKQILDWPSVCSLLGAQTFDAAEGVNLTWCPEGDSIDEWRPTKYQPNMATFMAPAEINGFTSQGYPMNCSAILGTGSSPYCIPCDGDPAVFKSLAELVSGPGVAQLLNTMAPDAGVPGGQSDQNAYVWAINKMLARVGASADPVLIVLGTDLPVDASFSIETIANYEALPDTRSFSTIAPQVSRTTLADGVAGIRQLAATMPRSGPAAARGIIAKIAAGIQTAVSAGKLIVRGAGQALPVAASTLRSMGLETEAGLVDSIAEGGAGAFEALLPVAAALAL